MTARSAVELSEGAKGHLAMLAFSALVAGSFSLGAMTANDMAPVAMNAVRFALAACVVGGVLLATGGWRRSATKAPWRYFVVGGLFAIYFVLMFEGLKTAPPVSAAAVFTLIPIMSGVAGYALMRQITTPRMALALAIGAMGALWVIFRADLGALLNFHVGQGEVIYFWGCVAHALFTPMMRFLNRGETALMFSFGTLSATAVILIIYGAPELWAVDWANLPRLVWIAILYLAVMASSITVVLLQFATQRLPSAKVMAYTYLTPSWVICWEIGLGHGAPTGLVLGGIALTVIALGLLLKDQDRIGKKATR